MHVLRVLPFFLSSKYTDPSNLNQRGKKGRGEEKNPLLETTETLRYRSYRVSMQQLVKKPISYVSAF